MTWNNRPEKEKAREFILLKNPTQECVNGRQYIDPFKVSAWMPASSQLCVKFAESQGLILENAYLIERDIDVCTTIAKELKNVKFNVCYTHLEEWEITKSLDFAFLDLLGSFTPKLMYWFNDCLSKNINCGARLCFTHTYTIRNNNEIYKQFSLNFKKYFPDLYETVLNKWQYEEYCKNNDLDPYWFIFPSLILKCCFNNYDFISWEPFNYKDSKTRMIVFVCDDFQFQLSPQDKFPSIDEVVNLLPPPLNKTWGRVDYNLKTQLLKKCKEFYKLKKLYQSIYPNEKIDNEINDIINKI